MEKMTAEEAAEWGKTLDFPTVWAAMMKSDEKIDKLGERIDRQSANIDKMREKDALIDARFEKMGERVDRVTANVEKLGEKLDRVSSNVGGLNESMGDLIETLFIPHLGDKFDVYNYNLKRIRRRVPIYDDNNRQRSDIDILLSNTTLCMAVEVKRWLEDTNQVDYHIKRMQLIRQYPPEEVKGKKLLGAIVGAMVTTEAREYAEQNGFFVLELTGEDVRLLEPPNGFQPKEW
jgi:cytochrome c556